LGCKALRVSKPQDIKPALDRAQALMQTHQVPVVLEVILERVTNISMGTEVSNVAEFEQLAEEARADAPTAIALLD
jgi:tartronate-semialdehyde synthase